MDMQLFQDEMKKNYTPNERTSLWLNLRGLQTHSNRALQAYKETVKEPEKDQVRVYHNVPLEPLADLLRQLSATCSLLNVPLSTVASLAIETMEAALDSGDLENGQDPDVEAIIMNEEKQTS